MNKSLLLYVEVLVTSIEAECIECMVLELHRNESCSHLRRQEAVGNNGNSRSCDRSAVRVEIKEMMETYCRYFRL